MEKKAKKSLSAHKFSLLFVALAIDTIVYHLAKWITAGFPYHDMTTAVDMAVPFVPQMIVVYYCGFLFCAVNYVLSFKYDERKGWQFFIALWIGLAVCFAVFVFYPTTMMVPEITGRSVVDQMGMYQYSIDRPGNLFPSQYCFSNWMCWIGVRGKERIPDWYQKTSLAMAIIICISTLMVKRQVIAGAICGIALAEFSYRVSFGVSKKLRSRGRHAKHTKW